MEFILDPELAGLAERHACASDFREEQIVAVPLRADFLKDL